MIANLFAKNQPALVRRWTPRGVLLERHPSSAEPGSALMLDSYFAQLADDGLATTEANSTLILWGHIYGLAATEAYRPFYDALNLPPV